MFRSLIAALIVAAPAAAAPAEDRPGAGSAAVSEADQGEGWALAAMPNGCMVQAVSPKGTMLSIWGLAGEDSLGFLVQNPDWTVRDGQRYDLRVEFLGARSWPVEATAREHIDADGPGFFFTVKPSAAGFLSSLTSAEGMRIQTEGGGDTLPLAGSRVAMSGLAKCLSARWSEGPPEMGEADPAKAEVLPTI
jgi:hypothetical protein